MSGERTAIPNLAGERETLMAALDHCRDTLAFKTAGLRPDQLMQPSVPPSPLTLLGILRHMTEVEHFWFESTLLGKDEHVGFFGSEDSDGDFFDLRSHPVSVVLGRWREACSISRDTVAGIEDWDMVSARPRFWDGIHVNLRWMMQHMIREYSRHLGHADLLRECIDGETGV